MNTKDVETVKMFGPSISNPSRVVNRDVPKCDIGAYTRAGYQMGSINEIPAPVVYSEADAIAQNDGVDVTQKPKGKVKK